MVTMTDQANSSRESFGLRMALGLCLAAAIGAVAWAIVLGGNMRAAADLAEKNEIARENKELCNGLGFAERDNAYARCVSGIDEIRRKQNERWGALTGLL